MQFNLDQNEISFIMQMLGQLPTSSGAYPLVAKIEQQIKNQVKSQDKDEEKPE